MAVALAAPAHALEGGTTAFVTAYFDPAPATGTTVTVACGGTSHDLGQLQVGDYDGGLNGCTFAVSNIPAGYVVASQLDQCGAGNTGSVEFLCTLYLTREAATTVGSGQVAFVTAIFQPDPPPGAAVTLGCGIESHDLGQFGTEEYDGPCDFSVSNVPAGYTAEPVACAPDTVTATTLGCDLVLNATASIYGFLQPVNDPAVAPVSARSVYKAGSTIPVKFQLRTASGSLVDDTTSAGIAATCGATLQASYAAAATSSLSVDESAATSSPTTGNCFRYDATGHQFVYNLATTKANAGRLLTLTATVGAATHTLGGQYAIGIK